MKTELLIQNGAKIYQPIVEEGITYQTDRQGSPSELKFTVVKDDILDVTEGNAVRFKVDDVNVFYGFIFSKKRTKEGLIEITAYDQLRYLKNKDTYVYTNKTADEFIRMLASDFQMQVGTLESTKYKIASRVEENTSLFDMIQNALDITLLNTKEMYVLYDLPKGILDNFNSVNFIEENKFLILEEGVKNIIILSKYDFEDFDFIKGE